MGQEKEMVTGMVMRHGKALKGLIVACIFFAGMAQAREGQEIMPSRIALHQALEWHLPKNYQFNSDGIDLSTEILYDASLPWMEALGKALSDAGLEMHTDLFKRIVMIKRIKSIKPIKPINLMTPMAGSTPMPASIAMPASHFVHAPAAPSLKTSGSPARIPITVQQALTKYVPTEYSVSIADEIDTKAIISYDAQLPWMEALGKGLTAVGLDVRANMHKKNLSVSLFRVSLAEVIEKHVPLDYKVYTDAEINTATPIRYDESLHWIEALSKGAITAGIDVTANITRKLIVIKPMTAKNESLPN